MARIVYSALVTSIRGSIGGTTFQNNAYGFTIKNKPNVIRPNTPNQELRKLALSRAVKSWAGLSDAERSDWNTWAAANPQFAKHNQSSVLSGYAVFTRSMVFLMIGTGLSAVIVTAPSYTIIPLDTVTWTVSDAGQPFTITSDWVIGDGSLQALVYATRQFLGSQTFIGSAGRFIIELSTTDATTNIGSEYAAIFGREPALAESFWLSWVLYNPLNGQVFARSNQLLQRQ